jgi:uncharacterized protein
MLFAIISDDVSDSLPLRMGARPAHIERLQLLQQQGRLTLAGPHPLVDEEGFSGSLVVAEFDDLASAQAWANADPYITAGVYAKVTVKPFKQVLP